uniref:FIG007317: Chromosome segregation protein SMC-like n=1 Tax=uncultured Thiotrichaceae bacterium TaxID=298394 RepID=A0A6S6TYS6_9GAMM|nr:MAG: FIG007317: Chromosome segregation protein SMC-like [uncultured Thiotrichaceae bacterium]
MTQPQLDLLGLSSTLPTGFRLHHMEFYNWGTFHDHIWHIAPDGNNSLLTGDIGSGKSTVVDALTTLLVSTQKITYNKAAGAESKERSLNSYVRGAYKSEKSELTQASKAVTLRDGSSYTVLLAWFYNADFSQGMTLAQVFWLKEGNHQPERFYVTADSQLSIKQHFSGFGSDINQLRKKLRNIQGVTISTTYREYATLFRRQFGIQSEQALDLFYQTVSMKSVGNLTEFVRQHMLEATDVRGQLDEMLNGFENLNRLHEAVTRARAQIEQLVPLCDGLQQHQQVSEAIEALRAAREALAGWFAGFHCELLQEHISKLEQQASQLTHRLEKLAAGIQGLRDKENDLHRSIEDQGGRRLREIEREIRQLEDSIKRCKTVYRRYENACQQLELEVQAEETQFYANQQQLEKLDTQLETQENELQQQRDHNAIQLSLTKKEFDQLQREIDSLRQRKSNIPLRNLAIRQQMIEVLGLEEDDLPFTGELLQVDEQEAEWEGAIERVLHNFGLSLLVPERLYNRVSQYVEQTHLKGRLVFFRVQDQRRQTRMESGTLASKVRIKPDSEFYEWLEQELSQRFNYYCCDSLDEFRRHTFAITQSGQIKSGHQRHEKDDRYNIHDRSRYVLGWSNVEKLKVLLQQQEALGTQGQQFALAIQQLEQQQRGLRKQATAIRDLQTIVQFSDIDWHSPTLGIEILQQEQRGIENSSDILLQLQQQLQDSVNERQQQEIKEKQAIGEQGELRNKLSNARDDLQQAQELAADSGALPDEAGIVLLNQWREKILGDTALNLRNLDKSQRDMREAMNIRIQNDTAKLSKVTERIIQQMQNYKNDYPTETSEVDAQLAAGYEYRAMLETLQREDLPRHEAKFKQMLNEQTIQSVVMFQNQLEKERRLIEEKITAINQSLQQIEYNQGTYIKLRADSAPDVDVRDFQAELRQVLSNTLDNDELYTEERFLQVKAIMEKLRGREGQVEQDKRWMQKVIDVRNWYNFSASERWRENDEEREFYSDSSGKSGGQKEKLAYTILASALAYQFGLARDGQQKRSFRFVVIDEAFGKGSDESTRYALELFRKLSLQLLIVTPLQKIHVIEDYIQGVHFVHNREGRYSMLRNLGIEEYQAEKAKVAVPLQPPAS